MNIAGFYSDPHFGHEGIIKACSRPYGSLQDMHEEMMIRYNDVVRERDMVVWVGDCFFYSKDNARSIMSHLNGKKILVMGNHDKSKTWMLDVGFDVVVQDKLFVKVGDRICRVCHFPYAKSTWRDGKVDDRFLDRRPEKIKGEILIHGHTHSTKRRNGNMIHVGVDAWNYRPALWHEVEALVKEI